MIGTNLKLDENSIFSLYKHNKISDLTHNINQIYDFNQTLLYLDSFESDIELVKDLLKYGVNLKMDNTEISKILTNNSANLTTEIISPLTQISRYLLENDIDFKECHHKGYNSSQICFLLADYELFKLVLRYYFKN